MLPSNFRETVLWVGLLSGLLYVACAALLLMYSGRYVSGTLDETYGVVAIGGFVTLVGSLGLFVRPGTLPRASFIVAGAFAVGIMLGLRFMVRTSRVRRALSRDGKQTLIYGAGDAGSQLAALMQSEKASPYIPIGFIDDDPAKRHLRRSNLRVLGTGEHLNQILQRFGVDLLVIAIAEISNRRLQEIDQVCGAQGVRVQVIPTASEVIGGALRLGDVSDLSEEEVMGRRAVSTNEDQIADFLFEKSILVTGAGGSIGSELARQLHRYRPSRVMLLDRDESALHETQLSIDNSGLLTSPDLILCDIRDAKRISQVLREYRPDIVFHAAALKHLTFLERFPTEAWKTNVVGTENLLSASEEVGVSSFVNISTDKAADPSSVLGYSKRVTERLVAKRQTAPGTWVSVRFGNVLGSRGSVLATFRHQIMRGGPVTVTHPDVTRYFMTVREAVHLVLQAAVLGRSGETLILDMGQPVKILDIAQFMIQRSGRHVDVVYTGLRPGEKLNEVLVGSSEEVRSPEHPLIAHTSVPGLTFLPGYDDYDEGKTRALLMALAASDVDGQF